MIGRQGPSRAGARAHRQKKWPAIYSRASISARSAQPMPKHSTSRRMSTLKEALVVRTQRPWNPRGPSMRQAGTQYHRRGDHRPRQRARAPASSMPATRRLIGAKAMMACAARSARIAAQLGVNSRELLFQAAAAFGIVKPHQEAPLRSTLGQSPPENTRRRRADPQVDSVCAKKLGFHQIQPAQDEGRHRSQTVDHHHGALAQRGLQTRGSRSHQSTRRRRSTRIVA